MSEQGPVLVGIDVGTSSVKVVATDQQGRLVGQAAAGYATTTERGGGAEQNAADWITALVGILPGVVRGRRTLGVAVTSQAPTLVPTAADGTDTGPALTWLDRRAAAEAARIQAIAPGTRNGADPFFGTAKLPWLLANRAETLGRSRRVLTANGFVNHFLTGVASLDDSSASLMQGFDESAGEFDSRLIEAALGLHLLAPISRTTDVIGAVTAEAASVTGLTPGTPVAAGAIDAVGSALEAGAVAVGDPLVEMTGFSSVTMLTVPAGTHVAGFIHARHCFPGVDLLITAQVTAGATIDWVNGLDPTRDLRELGPLTGRERPSRLTFIPALAGERTPTWNAEARGILDGIDLTTDGVEMMLAAMEGNSLALAMDLATLREHGFAVDRMLCTGGGANSPIWLQIKCDVTGLTVQRPHAGHGAAQGASYLAGLAIGLYSTPEDIRRLTADIAAEYQPDPALHVRYRAKLDRYTQLNTLNDSQRYREHDDEQ